MSDKSEMQELYEFMRNNLATKSDLEGLATKVDVADIKKTLDDHTEILNEHTETLGDHTRRLNRIEADVKHNVAGPFFDPAHFPVVTTAVIEYKVSRCG